MAVHLGALFRAANGALAAGLTGWALPGFRRIEINLYTCLGSDRLNIMNPLFRFLLACLGSSLSALLLMTLTIPIYLLAVGESQLGGFNMMLVSSLMLLPFVLAFGGVIALPAAAVAGGAMLWWQKRRGLPVAVHIWMIAGTAAGVLVSIVIGSDDPLMARMATTIWFAAAGTMGAWVFQRIMRGASAAPATT